MKTLKSIVEAPGVYQAVLKDGLRVLDDEVSKRSGISGLAIKGAYKLLKGVQGGRALEKAVEILMPEFIEAFEPYFEKYQAEGKRGSFESFIAPHLEELADKLLSITDKKAAHTDAAVVRNTYQKLRPKAKKEVVASLPALARMIDRYTAG
jgi:hypothetical protein